MQLFISDQNGNYTEAPEVEILTASATILETQLVGESLTDPDKCKRFLNARLGRLEHEVFGTIFMDTRHRVIAFEELFRGTINGAAVYPREVVKRALALNAAAVIFAHNHPSGVAEPSQADQSLTKRLTEALEIVDCRVLDHIVIGHGSSVSFSERGLI